MQNIVEEMQEALGMEVDVACVQECAAASTSDTTPPQGKCKWSLNPTKSWDTAIGFKWDEGLIREEGHGAHWFALTWQHSNE